MSAPAEAPTFKVVEKFVSLNGEGLNAGRMAAFIRLAGCNLRCAWCDTSYSWDDASYAERLTAEELLAWVQQTGVRCVTLTGGEPLKAPQVDVLLAMLLGAPQGFEVEVETNGSVALDAFVGLRELAPGKLRFTMDYKLPSSGMTAHMCTHNNALLCEGDCLKLVIGSEEDLAHVQELMASLGDAPFTVLLSCVFGSMEPAHVAEWMIAQGYADARLQLQLHKFIWPPDMRGV